ncbi:hypothetical protein GC167_09105 [bacterium]|nr:hypothetical protein [bacterium]
MKVDAQFTLELGITAYDYIRTEFINSPFIGLPGNPSILEHKASPFIYYLNYQKNSNRFFISYYSAWFNSANVSTYGKSYYSLGYTRNFHNWFISGVFESMYFYQLYDQFVEYNENWEIPYDLGLGLHVGYVWNGLKIRYRREGLLTFDERTVEAWSPWNQWFFDFTGTIPLDNRSPQLEKENLSQDHWLVPEFSIGLEIGLNELNVGGPLRLYPIWRLAVVGGEEYQLSFSRSQWWSYAPFQNFISDDVLSAEINTVDFGYRFKKTWDLYLGHSWNRKSYYLNYSELDHRWYYERAISPAVGYRHNQFTFQLRADIKYQYEPQAEVFNRGDVRFGVLYRFK